MVISISSLSSVDPLLRRGDPENILFGAVLLMLHLYHIAKCGSLSGPTSFHTCRWFGSTYLGIWRALFSTVLRRFAVPPVALHSGTGGQIITEYLQKIGIIKFYSIPARHLLLSEFDLFTSNETGKDL